MNAAVRANRGWAKRLRFSRFDVEPAVVDLPDLSVVAVTTRRFFVVSHDLSERHTSALLVEAPLDEVRSVEVDGGRVSWTARDARYSLWTNGKFAAQFAQALQR